MKVRLLEYNKVKLPNFKYYKHNSCNDIIIYKKIFYLAFRTSIYHFPNPKTKLIILSSKNGFDWQLEKVLYLGRDIREPRFVIFNNDLLLYYFIGNKIPLSFYPEGICFIKKSEKWEIQRQAFQKGFIFWRIKNLLINKKNILLASSHKFKRNKIKLLSKDQNKKINGNVFLLKSNDGVNWKILNKKNLPLTLNKKKVNGIFESSEFEYIFQKKDLIGLIRSELYGSFIIKIKDFIHKLNSKNIFNNIYIKQDKNRYDSPLFFKHKENIFLIARRNLGKKEKKYNIIKYSFSKKTTSLYLYNEKKGFIHLMDLPSQGDTGYSSIVKLNEKTKDNIYLIINYSSELKKYYNWITGQFKKTDLYYYIIEIK
ncbi:MAG: hypothetical protein QXR96_01255 [Candidatus Woesearchaeota archaeon]